MNKCFESFHDMFISSKSKKLLFLNEIYCNYVTCILVEDVILVLFLELFKYKKICTKPIKLNHSGFHISVFQPFNRAFISIFSSAHRQNKAP